MKRIRRSKSDPPKTGLWNPGGESSPQPLRSLRQRYAGSGKHLVVVRRLERSEDTGDLEPVFEPVRTVETGGRGHVEVRYDEE